MLMKKNYKTFIALCFAIIGLGISQPASTQPLLNDSFDYTAGNLYNQGNWWRYGTATENPIQTTETGLTYAGYQDNNVGRAAELGNLPLSESLVKKFTEGSEAITSGTLYYSALIQVKSAEEKENSILAFISKTYSSDVADGKKGNEYGKLFVNKGSNEGKVTMGVERYMLSPAMTTEEYNLNQTYLVVVKYEFVDGSNNDVISLFVNPADTETEPTEASAVFNGESGGDVNANLGIQGIELRQGATSSKPAANVIVDELRVATSYAALFDVDTDTPVEPHPQIITEETIYFMYNYIYQGETYEATLNVKAENLKGDITIAPLTSGEITLSTMTITKEQAEAEEGFDLTLTLTCTDANIMEETITLSSEGAEDVEVSVSWWPTAVVDVPDLATLAGKDATAYETYRYTGKAIVTFVDGNNYYLQDETAGFRINNEYGGFESVEAGDQFTNFYCYIESYFGALYASPAQEAPQPEVIATEQTVAPTVLTLAELGANLDKHVNMLVQVKNVTLTEVAGQTFTEDMTNPLISDGTGEGRLNLFDGTDIIGTTAPSAPFTLTGISTSASAPVVGPRTLADIETGDTPVEPQPQIITEETIYFMYNYIYQGETYEATLNVKGENLKGDITIAPLTSGEITLSTMTITKEQAEAEEGFDLTLTLTCTDASIMGETLTLSSEGAEDVEVSVAWWPTAVTDVPDLATLAGKDATAYETYRYTGKAIVTFVNGNNYYLQDETAGFRINNEYGGFESVEAGDQFTNFYCYIESYFGAMYASPAQEAPQPEVTASEQTVEPAVLTLAELGANLDKYVNMLVQVKDVTLTEVAGETFTEEMTNPLISDGTGEGRLNLFDGTDIIGTTAPKTAFTLTGISTSAGAPVVGPRALTDIEASDVRIEDAFRNGLSITTQEGTICIQGDVTGKMEVFDLTGRKVAETTEKETHMDSPAVYVVKFTTDEGSFIQKVSVK